MVQCTTNLTILLQIDNNVITVQDSYMLDVNSVCITIFVKRENVSFANRWSVQCCRQPGMCITDCSLSDYISDFEEDIDYSALEGEFFVGLFSHVDLPDEAYK